MPTRSSRNRYRRVIGLVACVALVAAIAQVAGVGGIRKSAKRVQGANVAVVAGSPVPDVTSSKLASTSVRAGEGEVVRMSATAQLLADSLGKAATGQGVCGITYSRDGDPAWSLGVPYETMELTRGKTAKVQIDRSFTAPAADRYRFEVRCHVSAPNSGAKVRGNAVVSTKLGLPKGAATPA